MSMNLQDPRTLRKALQEQNLRAVIRCIKAGQNPMHLIDEHDRPFFLFRIVTCDENVPPEILSIIAVRRHVDLNERYIGTGPLSFQVSILRAAWMMRRTKIFHLLLQAGATPDFTTANRFLSESTKEILLMMLSVGEKVGPLKCVNNRNNKSVRREYITQVERWLNGLLEAKDIFRKLFNPDLESVLAAFLFNEDNLRFALDPSNMITRNYDWS